MVIRKATSDDKQNLIAKLVEFDDYLTPLFSKKVVPFVDYKDKNKAFENVINEWLNNPSYILFVTEDNGNLVGHICGMVKADNFHEKDTGGYIEEWFVSEQYRHKGIGKRLYEALLAEFRKAKCTHLKLRVFADNKKSMNEYHKMGFTDIELTLIKKFI
jgi:ribosomal protein S18 acetylase RimI-like enzyme